MCIKKWFCKPDPVDPSVKAIRRLLTFGKNLYGGGSNLNGCVNDTFNLLNKCIELKPDFVVKQFLNDDVTVVNYKTEVANAISTLSPGAVVVIMADSCFSETITRKVEPRIGLVDTHPTKNRFYPPKNLHKRNYRRKRLFTSRSDIHWIVMSGCGEHQTSADAYINGQYVGAFTFFAVNTLQNGITYRQWFNNIRLNLPSEDFEQAPTLEGPDILLDKIIFEDETLIIHNSSHGTYTYDKNSEEADGYDEALYFDKILIDDEIGVILDTIPY